MRPNRGRVVSAAGEMQKGTLALRGVLPGVAAIRRWTDRLRFRQKPEAEESRSECELSFDVSYLFCRCLLIQRHLRRRFAPSSCALTFLESCRKRINLFFQLFHFMMLFQELVEQHRVHLLVPNL